MYQGMTIFSESRRAHNVLSHVKHGVKKSPGLKTLQPKLETRDEIHYESLWTHGCVIPAA